MMATNMSNDKWGRFVFDFTTSYERVKGMSVCLSGKSLHAPSKHVDLTVL